MKKWGLAKEVPKQKADVHTVAEIVNFLIERGIISVEWCETNNLKFEIFQRVGASTTGARLSDDYMRVVRTICPQRIFDLLNAASMFGKVSREGKSLAEFAKLDETNPLTFRPQSLVRNYPDPKLVENTDPVSVEKPTAITPPESEKKSVVISRPVEPAGEMYPGPQPADKKPAPTPAPPADKPDKKKPVRRTKAAIDPIKQLAEADRLLEEFKDKDFHLLSRMLLRLYKVKLLRASKELGFSKTYLNVLFLKKFSINEKLAMNLCNRLPMPADRKEKYLARWREHNGVKSQSRTEERKPAEQAIVPDIKAATAQQLWQALTDKFDGNGGGIKSAIKFFAKCDGQESDNGSDQAKKRLTGLLLVFLDNVMSGQVLAKETNTDLAIDLIALAYKALKSKRSEPARTSLPNDS